MLKPEGVAASFSVMRHSGCTGHLQHLQLVPRRKLRPRRIGAITVPWYLRRPTAPGGQDGSGSLAS